MLQKSSEKSLLQTPPYEKLDFSTSQILLSTGSKTKSSSTCQMNIIIFEGGRLVNSSLLEKDTVFNQKVG